MSPNETAANHSWNTIQPPSTSLSFSASHWVSSPAKSLESFSYIKVFFITLSLLSSCVLPSPNLQSIWATFYPSCTLGSLALFSIRMTPFKVIHDNFIAKHVGILSCLRSMHLTLPVPLLLLKILSALPALNLLYSLPLFPSLLLRAGLHRCSRKLVNNHALQGCPHSSEWAGQREAQEAVLTSFPK